MRNIINQQVYLERMAKPLAEKLKIINYFPKETNAIVDVGCADGTLTIEMAKLFPEINFFGIDLNPDFIKIAQQKSSNMNNVQFERIYLRSLLSRPEKYDAIIFCSVLHEFFTYGEGISSVIKALADARELLKKDGKIIIRDMILSESTKKSVIGVPEILSKIERTNKLSSYIKDFEELYGKLSTIYKLNHFLLKYMYPENWDRELKENYVPVTLEQYSQIFNLLGMALQHKETYLIPFLKEKWQGDFGLTEDELNPLNSTSILVAQNVWHRH